jgi:hypothetical protein
MGHQRPFGIGLAGGVLGRKTSGGQLPELSQDAHRHQVVADELLRRAGNR